MARLSLALLALCAVVAAVAAHGPAPAHGPPRHARAAAPAQAQQAKQPTLVKGATSHIPQIRHLQEHHPHFSFLSKVKSFLHKAADCVKQKAGPFVAAIKQHAHQLAQQVKPLLQDAEGKLASSAKAEAGKFLNQLKTAISAHLNGAQQPAPAQAPASRPKRGAPAPAPGPIVSADHPHATLINKIKAALHKAKAIVLKKAGTAAQAIKAKYAEVKKCLGPLVADTKNQISSVLKAQAQKVVSKLNQAIEKHQGKPAPLKA